MLFLKKSKVQLGKNALYRPNMVEIGLVVLEKKIKVSFVAELDITG